MKQQKDSRGGRHCTEVRFASFLSGGFITAIVVNPPERKLAKRTSVKWYATSVLVSHFKLFIAKYIRPDIPYVNRVCIYF